MKWRLGAVLTMLWLAVGLASPAQVPGPRHVYLTWERDDTGRTMTVNFQCPKPTEAGAVYYDTESRAGKRLAYRHKAATRGLQMTFAPRRAVHHVTLENLEPATTYYLVAGDSVNGYSPEYRFRTLPSTGPIRFVTGGDMFCFPETVTLLKQAAQFRPMFVAVGGDIAYDDGKPENYPLWDSWLDNYARQLRGSEGTLVPMVLAVGNHEVQGGFGRTPREAPAYFAAFAQGGRAYFQRKLSDHTLLVVLDSGHATPMGGDQARWLSSALAEGQSLRNRFALYHVALFPSHREFRERPSAEGRKLWVPIFDRGRLTVAFENHDHAFKRTHSLRSGKIDPGGTLYLGDGCFGVKPRTVAPSRRWYEARALSKAHFWVVEADSSGATCRAVDLQGRVFDLCVTGDHSK